MWRAVIAFACAVLAVVFVRASASTAWMEWDVGVVGVENLSPGYHVKLSDSRWVTRLTDEWNTTFARKNGLGVVQPGHPCGDDMLAVIYRSQPDVALEERLKWIVEGATWSAGIVMAISTINYFWSLFRVYQRSRVDVFGTVAMTLLFCITVVVVLALVDPPISVHWPCIIVNRGDTVHGEVTLRANLVGLRLDAIANLVAGLASLGMVVWQLQPWWRARRNAAAFRRAR